MARVKLQTTLNRQNRTTQKNGISDLHHILLKDAASHMHMTRGIFQKSEYAASHMHMTRGIFQKSEYAASHMHMTCSIFQKSEYAASHMHMTRGIFQKLNSIYLTLTITFASEYLYNAPTNPNGRELVSPCEHEMDTGPSLDIDDFPGNTGV